MATSRYDLTPELLNNPKALDALDTLLGYIRTDIEDLYENTQPLYCAVLNEIDKAAGRIPDHSCTNKKCEVRQREHGKEYESL